MADEPQAEATSGKKGGFVKPLIWATIGFLVGAGGFAVPLLMPGVIGGKNTETQQTNAPPKIEPAFIEFGEALVNLNSEKSTRYLRVNITLQVNLKDAEEVTALLDQNRAILKSWLLSHLSDKNMEEVRGAAGQNQMRREIQNHFNRVLCPDGFDRIHDVLFQEFNVQ